VKTGEKTPAFIRLSSLEGPARQGKPFTLTSPTQSLLPHPQGFFLWVQNKATLTKRHEKEQYTLTNTALSPSDQSQMTQRE